MKTEHTAGPWHVGMRPGPIIYGPKGEMVADMRCGEMLPENEALANMRLIASAPELLAALEGLVSCRDYRGIETHEMDRARAAIAKAKGQE